MVELLVRTNSATDETHERSKESSSSVYPGLERTSRISFLVNKNKPERTNSIIDEAYEKNKESSSSIYPDFERTLKINFRNNYIHALLKSLLPFSLQSSSNINLDTILNTVNWIIELRKIVNLRKYWWSEPLANISGSEIVFEWWHNTKKITIYFSETNAEFIKVWGADIDNEMEEGIAETNDQIEALWEWLAS